MADPPQFRPDLPGLREAILVECLQHLFVLELGRAIFQVGA